MLLLLFLIIAGFILLGLMSKEFYMYRVRTEESTVGRTSLGFGIMYLVLAVVLFITAFAMLANNKVQYTVTFRKLTTQEPIAPT